MDFKEYAELVKRYNEQKRLEEYQKYRVLPVPKTTKLEVVAWVFLLVLITVAVCFFCVILPVKPFVKIFIGIICEVVILEFYLKFLGVKIVECYQRYASPQRRRQCLCIPSCSQYAITCFKKYELIKALLKIRKRLYVTCVGDEYKIDEP